MKQVIRSLRYPFAIDAGLAELAPETDHGRHVQQMILQVLLTAPGERLNRPDFGCGVRAMVFAPTSDASASLAQVTILEALETWMGTLITVEQVEVKSADSRVDINIVYRLKATGERRYLNVEVES
jgi:phage baseplate assembly protein W